MVEMFSDEEADRLYLGKPFDDGSTRLYGGLADLITFSDEEIKRFFLDLPVISRLMNIPCKVGD
ncbi:MAG: hypothetical protein C4536_07865 [Actinobacteria bacterium]|jgi:hypothetical protein|nr:MAG: hypothetical protein C4536_07865 [Actinomycetota bacterium]